MFDILEKLISESEKKLSLNAKVLAEKDQSLATGEIRDS